MEAPSYDSACELLPPEEVVPIGVPPQVMDRDMEALVVPANLSDTPLSTTSRWGESEAFMNIDPIPVGRFRDGLCNCCAHGCCHGHYVTSCWCPMCEWV
jgi:hypothetical protein